MTLSNEMPKSRHGEEGTHYACLAHSDGENGCCACNPNQKCYWGESRPLPAPKEEGEKPWWEDAKYWTCKWDADRGSIECPDIPAILRAHRERVLAEAVMIERIRLENDYYVELFLRSNNVYISIRNKGDGTKGSRGGVALQYKVDLQSVLEWLAEDYDQRGSGVAALNNELKGEK